MQIAEWVIFGFAIVGVIFTAWIVAAIIDSVSDWIRKWLSRRRAADELERVFPYRTYEVKPKHYLFDLNSAKIVYSTFRSFEVSPERIRDKAKHAIDTIYEDLPENYHVDGIIVEVHVSKRK